MADDSKAQKPTMPGVFITRRAVLTAPALGVLKPLIGLGPGATRAMAAIPADLLDEAFIEFTGKPADPESRRTAKALGVTDADVKRFLAASRARRG